MLFQIEGEKTTQTHDRTCEHHYIEPMKNQNERGHPSVTNRKKKGKKNTTKGKRVHSDSKSLMP